MSSYNKIVFILLVFIFVGCTNNQQLVKQNNTAQEDLYIMMALDSEIKSEKENSLKYYTKLFKIVNKEYYLQKIILYTYELRDYQSMILYAQIGIKNFDNDEAYIRQIIVGNLGLKQYDTALSEARKLLVNYKSIENYEIIANVYYAKSEYNNAVKYYESAYQKNQNSQTLLKLTTVMYTYLDKKEDAISYLETYIQENGCTANICDKLMLIYQEQGNLNGMISILNKMYISYSKNPELKKTAKLVLNIIISLLEKIDVNQAISYLKTNNIENLKLLNLYEQNNQIKDALNLSRKLYRKYKLPILLGKIAMFEFELASDKKKVMKHVIANFELSLEKGIDNPIYNNYYGYILIDYNINIDKGIELVQKALIMAPKNIAYIDSLAWGYFKKGNCKDALNIMLKITDTKEVLDDEIKSHLNKINNCINTSKGNEK